MAAGRIFPFGKSTQANDDVEALTRYIEIRDYLFTVGGSGDVRGWNSRLLGPKIPDLQVSTGADSGQLRADRYVPVGGNARIAASVELRLPIPFLGPAWGTHVFLDGGKVWSVDSHYIGASDFDQQRFFFATGFGIDRDTPVGPLRLSLAYKLNPSQLDVLKPQEFLDALTFGTLDTVHTSWNRRLLLHLAIGSGF